MRKWILGVALSVIAMCASAQLIYGNTFPFWNVHGPLNVTGTTTLSGPVVMSSTVSMAGLVSTTNADFDGTGVTTAIPDWSLFNTGATTLRIGGAATTVTLGAATGTTTLGNALIGSIATDSTTSTTGAWKTAGGLGVAKALNVGTTFGVTGDATLGGKLIVSTSATPAAADACTAGTIVWGSSYIYICTASGAWKRAAITGGY